MNSEAADLLFQVDSLQVALGISLSGLLVELNAQNGAQVVDSSLDVVGLNSDVTVLAQVRSCLLYTSTSNTNGTTLLPMARRILDNRLYNTLQAIPAQMIICLLYTSIWSSANA